MRSDHFERGGDLSVEIELPVVDQRVQPLALEDSLHLTEAGLYGVVVGTGGDVEDGIDLPLLVEFVHDLHLVGAQLVHEERERPVVHLGRELLDERVEPVDAGDLLLGLDAYYTPGGTHGCNASAEANEYLILLDGDVGLPVAVLLLLQGLLGEYDFVKIDNRQVVHSAVCNFLQHDESLVLKAIETMWKRVFPEANLLTLDPVLSVHPA